MGTKIKYKYKVYCKDCKFYVKNEEFCIVQNEFTSLDMILTRTLENGIGDCNFYEKR